MSELKNQIEKMGIENLNLRKKLEEPEEIKEDYYFIGSLFDNKDNKNNGKQIGIFFGKYPDKIELNFENATIDFPIQKVIDLKKIKDKEGYILLELYDKNEEEKQFLCQFSEKESEYILKFYNNMKKTFEESKEQVTLINYNLDSFL